ncbi:uncharacterized protein BDV17DRAFT_21620 [Aspergillus undulatus]|uniref:uncharacterized protein n=1 Tax=Aspergillus undulatus TaxID=1810928 RepID=UPI003CCCF1E1
MAAKRLKTHHDFDEMSTCSTDSSRTLDFSESAYGTATISDHAHHASLPRRASPFLSLPIELRVLIYQYAFSASSSWDELINVSVDRSASRIHPNSPHKPLKYTRTPPLHLPVALLSTNQQIYHEALPVLFSGVRFSFALKPTSLTFLLDRFSETARNSIRYLRLYPAPLYVHDGTLGEQLSWAVLCAQVARLPSLRRVALIYHQAWDIVGTSVESQRARYGKSLSLIPARKELEFRGIQPTATEMEEYRRQFENIAAAPARITET